MKNEKHKLLNFFLLVFFVLVFTLPRIFQLTKSIVLFILILIYLFNLRLKPNFSNRIFVYFLIFIPSLIIAALNSNELTYVISSVKIFYFFPVVILLVFQMLSKESLIEIIYKSSWISIILISILGVNTLLFGLGIVPFNINSYLYIDEVNVGVHEGFVHIINSSLSYLIFLVPICFIDIKSLNIKSARFYFFIFLFLFALISGRRILCLPFIVLILINLKYNFKYVIFLVLFSTLFISNLESENFNLTKIFSRFEEAINSSGDSEVREEQSVYFKKYIFESPIVGNGLGAYMTDYIRNAEFKIAYEKSFYYLVYILGIPFAIIISVFYAFLLSKSFKFKTDQELKKKGIIVGIITLLLASSTNPYWLSSFDYTIPLAILLRLSQNDTR